MHICGCVVTRKVILCMKSERKRGRSREKQRERGRGGSDCVVSWDHGDYACGHWLPSLSTSKAWRIRINEVRMVSGCQTHAGCCLVMPAEYRQLVLGRCQLGKFNLQNTGQSLMRHQLSRRTVKWAHWQCMTSISLKTTWQQAGYSTVQHVANSRNTVCGCTSASLHKSTFPHYLNQKYNLTGIKNVFALAN